MALYQLEATSKKQWRLGQSIVLFWAFDPNGLLISGSRFKAHDEIFGNAGRLGVAPSFVKLNSPLDTGEASIEMIEASIEMIDEMIEQYSVGHEESRAVALFDIADFPLFRPFEQASQLNSLSYSLNPAYSKLKRECVEVNFARTTTGDGYYVWNRDPGAFSDVYLLTFFSLVLIDTAAAREKSQVSTVPTLCSVFHIRSHYVLSQAEGIIPTIFSYIVGDVRIKLARLIDSVPPAGIHIGGFTANLADVDTPTGLAEFLRHSRVKLLDMSGLRMDEKQLSDIRFESWSAGQSEERLIEVTDKHGVSQGAQNVSFAIGLEGLPLALGMRNR